MTLPQCEGYSSLGSHCPDPDVPRREPQGHPLLIPGSCGVRHESGSEPGSRPDASCAHDCFPFGLVPGLTPGALPHTRQALSVLGSSLETFPQLYI